MAHDHPTPPLIPRWLVILSILVTLALLAYVVTVGVWRNSIDFTAVAVMLGTLIGGLAGAAGWRVIRRDKDAEL